MQIGEKESSQKQQRKDDEFMDRLEQVQLAEEYFEYIENEASVTVFFLSVWQSNVNSI
jgi:hypothetical protein